MGQLPLHRLPCRFKQRGGNRRGHSAGSRSPAHPETGSFRQPNAHLKWTARSAFYHRTRNALSHRDFHKPHPLDPLGQLYQHTNYKSLAASHRSKFPSPLLPCRVTLMILQPDSPPDASTSSPASALLCSLGGLLFQPSACSNPPPLAILRQRVVDWTR